MRFAILGNSGSGKSTLARRLAARTGAPSLDLDTLAWVPGQVAVPRDPALAAADVAAFCSATERWIVEGCYGDLIRASLAWAPFLILLDPGEATCLAHCRARPWEPHKYTSKAEQDAKLAFLLQWVRNYYTREGDLSLAGHRALFEAYLGPKLLLMTQPDEACLATLAPGRG